MKKQQYQLMRSFLKDKFFISTIYRESSCLGAGWYFETMAWEWNKETQKKGSIIKIDESYSEETAINTHCLIVSKLNKTLCKPTQ
jgi:hypothetical protein